MTIIKLISQMNHNIPEYRFHVLINLNFQKVISKKYYYQSEFDNWWKLAILS